MTLEELAAFLADQPMWIKFRIYLVLLHLQNDQARLDALADSLGKDFMDEIWKDTLGTLAVMGIRI